MSDESMASAGRPTAIRVLLASQQTSSETWDAWQELSALGYEVQTAGIEETLWLWPLEGYDILVVDASKQPQLALDLCHLVKDMSPRQRIVLLLGEGTPAALRPFEADAILAANSIETQFVPAVHLLVPSSRPSAGEKKSVQSTRPSVEYRGGRPAGA